jgi:hypothetical protein
VSRTPPGIDLIALIRPGAQAAITYRAVASRLRARDLSPRSRGQTGRRRSWPFTSGHVAVCKNLQDVPEQASTIGIDWQSGGRADPDFPGSAAMGCCWCRPVTPEAAGSSPVDPANYHPENKGVPVLCGSLLANRPESAGWPSLQDEAKSVVLAHSFRAASEPWMEKNPRLPKRQGAGTPRPPAQIAVGCGNEKFEVVEDVAA